MHAEIRDQVEKLRRQVEQAPRRILDAKDDDVRAMLHTALRDLRAELAERERALVEVAARLPVRPEQLDVESEVQKALALLEHVETICADPVAREDMPRLLNDLGVRIGLTFRDGTFNSRRVRKLKGGVIAFGNRPLPCALRTGSGLPMPGGLPADPHHDHGCGCCHGCHEDHPEEARCLPGKQKALPSQQGGSSESSSLSRGGREDSSVDSETPRQPREARWLSKVSRGDWIRTSDLYVPKTMFFPKKNAVLPFFHRPKRTRESLRFSSRPSRLFPHLTHRLWYGKGFGAHPAGKQATTFAGLWRCQSPPYRRMLPHPPRRPATPAAVAPGRGRSCRAPKVLAVTKAGAIERQRAFQVFSAHRESQGIIVKFAEAWIACFAQNPAHPPCLMVVVNMEIILAMAECDWSNANSTSISLICEHLNDRSIVHAILTPLIRFGARSGNAFSTPIAKTIAGAIVSREMARRLDRAAAIASLAVGESKFPRQKHGLALAPA